MNTSADSPETTTSTISTFSPFSQSSAYSFGSEAGTSDEPADLGQFTTVFRALTELQSETLHNQTRIAVASNAGVIHHHRHAPSNNSNFSEFSFSGQSSSSAAQTSLGRSSSYRRPREGVRTNTITPTATSTTGRSIRKTLLEDDYEANIDVSQAISGYFSSSSNQDDSHYKQSGPSTSTILAPLAPINTSSSLQMNSSVSRDRFASDQDQSLASETEYDREEAELSLGQGTVASLIYSGTADHPSLGYLDDALSFIAAEREKLVMVKRRDPSVTSRSRSSAAASTGRGGGVSSQASTNESGAWYSGSPRRRKRRRKRGRHSSALSKTNAAAVPEDTSGVFEDPEAEIEEAGEEEEDILEGDVGDGSSSELDNDPDNDYDVLLSSSSYSKGKSLPATPPRLHRTRRRQQQQLQQQIEETSLGLTSVPNTNITTKAIKEYALLSNSIDNSTSTKNITSSSSRRLLAHSRSTPSLRSGPVNGLRSLANTTAAAVPLNPPTSRTLDPRVFRLRTLATKLRILFPDDAKWLSDVLRHLDSISTSASDKEPESSSAELVVGEVIDIRGRPIKDGDPPMHIFIDHSNILIGFLKHLRKYPPYPTRRGMKTHLSHSALALVLERGRPIARRVLATSSPLYQPMDGAEKLGYEVRVYVRVPDSGDGADRLPREGKHKKVQDKAGISTSSGQSKNMSTSNGHNTGSGAGGGGTSTESDSGGASKQTLLSKSAGYNHSRNGSLTNGVVSFNGLGISSAADSAGSLNALSNKIRYREQGVDELLQLKLLQAIADVDEPPPGSTIVLATGDGNVGQFNEEGFLGCVRTALKKGWCVELYAWEVGLSRAWAKEFGSGSYKNMFRIIGLERYAEDLLEIP